MQVAARNAGHLGRRFRLDSFEGFSRTFRASGRINKSKKKRRVKELELRGATAAQLKSPRTAASSALKKKLQLYSIFTGIRIWWSRGIKKLQLHSTFIGINIPSRVYNLEL